MKHDPVNYPSHYTDGGIETIDFIEAKKLNYNLGSAVKYVSRHGKKADPTGTENLEKAVWYLQREIGLIRKGYYSIPIQAGELPGKNLDKYDKRGSRLLSVRKKLSGRRSRQK